MKEKHETHQSENLTIVPGKRTQDFGITTELNKGSLSAPPVWIEESEIIPKSILATPRIGISYAGEDAKRLWRFEIGSEEYPELGTAVEDPILPELSPANPDSHSQLSKSNLIFTL